MVAIMQLLSLVYYYFPITGSSSLYTINLVYRGFNKEKWGISVNILYCLNGITQYPNFVVFKISLDLAAIFKNGCQINFLVKIILCHITIFFHNYAIKRVWEGFMVVLSSGQVRAPYLAATEHQLRRSNIWLLLLYHFYCNLFLKFWKIQTQNCHKNNGFIRHIM